MPPRKAAPPKTTTSAKKRSTAKKSTAKKSTAKKSSAKKPSSRTYSPAAGEALRSGRSRKKVTDPKQALAIGLSEARREGKKVPPDPNRRAKKKA
jgi:hypothetical protein